MKAHFVIPTRRTRTSAILLALAAHAQSVSATAPRQFDLVCDIRGHVVADPHPRFRGTYPTNLRAWHNRFRMLVDLRTMRFCNAGRCLSSEMSRIVEANARQIVLARHPRPDGTNNGLIESFRYRDGYYRARLQSEDGFVILETGFCRRERFSGFPGDTESAAARH